MTDAVTRYYDGNTRRFLRFGSGRGSLSIHRLLWGPGVHTPREAAGYIHGWITARLEELALAGPLTVLDLGCGVGGTLFHLGEAFPGSRLHGITLSGRQVEVARREAARREAAELESDGRDPAHRSPQPSTWHFVQGDFHEGKLMAQADLAVAIESFAHSPSPRRFLTAVAGQLRPGGVLVVVDDFLARDRNSLLPGELARLVEFQAGWRLGPLGTLGELEALAREAGLTPLGREDFTPLIRLDRPRDRVIARIAPVAVTMGLESSPFFGNLVGGNALRDGLRRGWLRYQAAWFRAGSVSLSSAGLQRRPKVRED